MPVPWFRRTRIYDQRDGSEETNDFDLPAAIAVESKLIDCRINNIANINSSVNAGLQEATELLQQRGPNATPASNQGLVAEIAHKTSFNANAIQTGSELRAEVVPGGKAADIRIFTTAKPEVDVAQAQLKISEDRGYLKQLNNPKYDGMQKVVPSGMEDAAKGRTASVQCEGVSSSPLSVEQADQLAQNPKAYFDTLRPNPVAEAAAAGLQGAALGGLVGAGATLGSALWSRGSVSKEDAKQAAVAGAVGAAAGGTAGVVGTLAGSSVAGGLAGGLAATACGVAASRDPEERRRLAVTGAAGVAAGMGAAALSSAALSAAGLAAMWPLGVAAPMAAYASADRAARSAVEPHCDTVAAAAEKGAESAGRLAAAAAAKGVQSAGWLAAAAAARGSEAAGGLAAAAGKGLGNIGCLAAKGRDRVGPLVKGGMGAVAATAQRGYQGAELVGGKVAQVAAEAARKGCEGAGLAAGRMAESAVPVGKAAWGGAAAVAGGAYSRVRSLVARPGGREDAGGGPSWPSAKM